jgi:hypothetical protein
MFTSCGWFFDDFDRIERATTWLTPPNPSGWQMATGADLSGLAQSGLARVKSWRSSLKADAVFRKHYQRAAEQWSRGD